jgi:CRP-like cAMP-binding protein
MALTRAAAIAKYGRGETIFTQGDACSDVLCIRTGGVKLTVLSKTGYEVTVAMLGPGDFFGEGCLAGLKNLERAAAGACALAARGLRQA